MCIIHSKRQYRPYTSVFPFLKVFFSLKQNKLYEAIFGLSNVSCTLKVRENWFLRVHKYKNSKFFHYQNTDRFLGGGREINVHRTWRNKRCLGGYFSKIKMKYQFILAAAGNLEPCLTYQNVNCVISIDRRNPWYLILVWCRMNVVFSTLFGNVLKKLTVVDVLLSVGVSCQGCPWYFCPFYCGQKTFSCTRLEHFCI